MTITISNTLEEVSHAVLQIEEYLKTKRVNSKDRIRSILLLEETLIKICDTSPVGNTIVISTERTLKKRTIKISYKGDQAPLFTDGIAQDISGLNNEYTPEAENYIRELILRTNSSRIQQTKKGNSISIKLCVSVNEKISLFYTLAALILGILTGISCRFFLPCEYTSVFNEMAFKPLYTVFISAIKMVMAPLVFFSLTASIGNMSDLNSLGRMGMKVFCSYIFTTICAIALSFGVNHIYQPGNVEISNLPQGPLSTEHIELSLFHTIIGIVPDNIFTTFVKGDMLQIMFLAILTGIAIGKMNKHTEAIRKAMDILNELFSSITSIISDFLPFAVFGSMAFTLSTLDASMFAIVCRWGIEIIICSLLMYLIYLLLLVLGTRLNPLKFISKSYIVSLTGLMTSSSSATMPTSLDCCRRLGISPRLYTFSIPLGVTINMDGLCIMFTTASLFLASLYGINVEGGLCIQFITTMLLLSIALPGVPGAATASMLMLFSMIGVPAEAFSLIIGLCPLVELLATSINVTGDCVVTTLVARNEQLLDAKKYNE